MLAKHTWQFNVNHQFDYEDIIQRPIIKHFINEQLFTKLSTNDSRLFNSKDFKWSVPIGLHRNNKQKTFESIISGDIDANTLAQQISAFLGTRKGLVIIILPEKFYDTNIDDVVQITRKNLPGFEFDESINRVRKYRVVGVVKNLQSVTLTLDDQKGTEDNPGLFTAFEPPPRA